MKKIIINIPKTKVRKHLPSHLVVTKIEQSDKHKKTKHKFKVNTNVKDLDALDDRFYR